MIPEELPPFVKIPLVELPVASQGIAQEEVELNSSATTEKLTGRASKVKTPEPAEVPAEDGGRKYRFL